MFIEQRREALQSYLQGAVDSYPTLPVLVAFLQEGACAISERQQTSQLETSVD